MHHKPSAQQDERYTKQLAHIEKHTLLEVHLDFLRIFNEEAEGEDEEDAQPEEEARAHLLAVTAVEPPAHKEEQEVGDGLVQLTRMAGDVINSFEDESPRHLRWITDNLGVHQVAQTDGTGTDGGDNGDVIQH